MLTKFAYTLFIGILGLICSIGSYGQVVSFEVPKPYSFDDIKTTINTIGTSSNQDSNTPLSLVPNVPSYYSQNSAVKNPSAWIIEKYLVSPEEDIRQYELQKQKEKEALTEIYKTIEESRIYYRFPNPSGQTHQRFEIALSELTKMLTGELPLEITRAQYLVEGAYDHRLTYDFLKKQVLNMAYVTQVFMQEENLPMSDNLAKIMAIFHVMADTTTVKVTELEKDLTTYPMLYDFEDAWGKEDYTKMFVSKLISTGTGNCSSLPRLFLMIGEHLGIEANLAFAPQHTYVKFQDHFGEWHNVELTNQIFTTDDHIMDFGWVKSEAVRSGIYMTPISKKELIAHSVSELAMAHYKIFGNTSFIKRCTDVTLKYYPNSITAHQVEANYYTDLMRYITDQYKAKGLTSQQLQRDQKALNVYENMNTSYQAIDDLGFAEVPEALYNQWIKAMSNEGNKQESRNKMRQMLNTIDR